MPSRDEALEVLATVLVAPVTSTIRDLPSQVEIGTAGTGRGLGRRARLAG